MLKAEQIPKECREAFYQAYWRSGLPSHTALAAALNAWPRMKWFPADKFGDGEIVLPLPVDHGAEAKELRDD